MSYFLVKIAVIIATATSNITPQMRKIAKSKKIEAKISPIRYEPPTAANLPHNYSPFKQAQRSAFCRRVSGSGGDALFDRRLHPRLKRFSSRFQG